ncbi:MAG TPA: hypothetical protein VF647_21675 [Longimicrobium sp.]|jgi:hypothetical protein
MHAPAIIPAAAWVPLEDAWRATWGGDPKFYGLAVAALFRLGVPAGALVLGAPGWDADTAERAAAEAIAWIESAEGRPVGAAGPDGIPLLLTVRFGDKYSDPRKPPSVSLIGAAAPRTSAEAEAHLRAFLGRIDAAGQYDALAALPPAARAARIAALGFARLVELGVERPQVLLQRAAVTVDAPDSGHGTAYTRHPQTAAEMDYGRYMWDATGHEFDARSGDPRKRDLSVLADEHPASYARLRSVLAFVEAYFQEIRFVEFGLERGRLYIFQVTPRKRAEGTMPSMRRLPPVSGEVSDPPPAPLPGEWRELRMEGLAVRVGAGAAAEAIREVSVAADPPGADTAESWLLTLEEGTWPADPPPGGVPRVMERSVHGVHRIAWSVARAHTEWIVESRWGSALRIEPGTRTLRVHGPARAAADLAAHTVEALRREYLEAHGWACLHAASVEIAGRAWLLVGDKGAGKTTLQLALLDAGARLLSADRTWVAAGAAGPAARRGPGALRVTGHTLALVPGVVETGGGKPSVGSGKYTLPLARFAAAGMLSGSARLPLGGYVFVRRGEGAAGWRVRPAAADSAAAHLMAGPADHQQRWLHAWRWWGAGSPPAIPAAPAWSLEGSGSAAEAARRVMDVLAGEG